MSGTATSPDPFWPESSPSNMQASPSPFNGPKKTAQSFINSPFSFDETSDFHDPYSDLNLFLSQKIKQEMQHCGSTKKWSHKIEDDLLQKITPEFQKRFPHYRLGVAALKKIWEKVSYYAQQIQGQKEAITQDGKLNVNFFIKENLKQYSQGRSTSQIHPYHYAHQLAMKMSECIATVDGVRPKLDYLTKTIWSVQRHLLNEYDPEKCKSPYDEYDKVDKLIVKAILEITAKEPHIGQNELEYKVKETLHSLHELPNFTSLDNLTGSVCALLAEKLYSACPFHALFFAEQKTAIYNFIRRHSSMFKKAICSPALTELVRRVIALYTLASGLPKNISKDEMFLAIESIYPALKAERPPLNQSVYAFIAAEIVLMRTHEQNHSMEHIQETIWTAYREAIYLPELKGKEADILEIVMWKHLSETEGLLEHLPYRIGQRIEEEIAGILIDNPSHSFSSLIHETMQYFKKMKDLTLIKKWPEIEKKIHTWVIQGDMLCRWIRLSDNALLKLINKRWEEKSLSKTPWNHRDCINEISQEYLKEHPELAIYSPQLSSRISILYKYVWYTHPDHKNDSSLERYIKWHLINLLSMHSEESHLLHQIEETMKKMIPLIPFNPALVQKLISSIIPSETSCA